MVQSSSIIAKLLLGFFSWNVFLSYRAIGTGGNPIKIEYRHVFSAIPTMGSPLPTFTGGCDQTWMPNRLPGTSLPQWAMHMVGLLALRARIVLESYLDKQMTPSASKKFSLLQ